MERYPKPNGMVGVTILDREIFSLLDIKTNYRAIIITTTTSLCLDIVIF
jgi:hypothetical protein